MKYLCLIYGAEKDSDAIPREQLAALVQETLAYTEVMKKSGHYVASQPLEPVKSAVTIRARDGKVSVTDGPFAETKEQLGGFYMIEAQDLNEAVRVASKIPCARMGCVEVRPVMDLETLQSQCLDTAMEKAGLL